MEFTQVPFSCLQPHSSMWTPPSGVGLIDLTYPLLVQEWACDLILANEAWEKCAGPFHKKFPGKTKKSCQAPKGKQQHNQSLIFPWILTCQDAMPGTPVAIFQQRGGDGKKPQFFFDNIKLPISWAWNLIMMWVEVIHHHWTILSHISLLLVAQRILLQDFSFSFKWRKTPTCMQGKILTV